MLKEQREAGLLACAPSQGRLSSAQGFPSPPSSGAYRDAPGARRRLVCSARFSLMGLQVEALRVELRLGL